jgi:hypothetical protein
MKIRFFRSTSLGAVAALSLGVAAMVVADCGYAAAQSLPENIQLISANASLVGSLDSKNATQGQVVTAKLNSNVKAAESTELPKGTMLLGKVEQVQMSTDKGPAKISIVFDQARLSNGHTVPIKATLLAAYPAETGDFYADSNNNGSLAGVQSHFIPADRQIDQEPGTLSHVAMHSAVASNSSGVFTSKDRNIDLRSGTEFQIALAPENSSAGVNGAE